MHHLSRLDKAFLRKGIQLSRANNIVSLSRPSGASARVLLPDELPLEEKAVTQLLDFAEVKLPDHPGYVRQTCATPDFHPGNGVPVGAVVATTPARAGALALIPGSMGDYSWLAVGCGNPEWLWSCSHGAGRSQRRQAMRSRATAESTLPWQCVTLREERRIEEAPAAYKDIGPVIEAQQEAGLIQPAVRFRPRLTFKG